MGYYRLPLVATVSLCIVCYGQRFAQCRYHFDARNYYLDPFVCSDQSIHTFIGLMKSPHQLQLWSFVKGELIQILLDLGEEIWHKLLWFEFSNENTSFFPQFVS